MGSLGQDRRTMTDASTASTSTSVASIYQHYGEGGTEGRSNAEVDEILRWLTGTTSTPGGTARRADFETFFSEAPLMNPARRSIRASSAASGSKTSRSR